MSHRLYVLTIISTIVLSTIMQSVTGGSLFGDEVTRTTPHTTTTVMGSANSLKLSWITISSISVIVIGLINGHLRRFIF
ncbi:unnamed protein product [Schistosoma spindalis]|nr:unnamed protein product [Schistosoma spindale]